MKFRNLIGFMAAATAVASSSCGSASSADPQAEMIPVQLESDGNWSFYKPDGTIVMTDEFKEEPTVVLEGVFSVKENDHITLYEAGDKPKAIKGCDDLLQAGYMSEGLIPVVRKNSRIALVNKSGATKFTLDPVGGKEIVRAYAGYSDGLLRVENQDGKTGYVDKSGKVAIELKYADAYNFAEGMAIVGSPSADSTYTAYEVIDKGGKTQFKIHKDYDIVFPRFVRGRLLVRDANDHYLLLDKKGEAVKLPSKAHRVEGVGDNVVVYRSEDGEYGVMDFNGEVIVRAKYDQILILDDGRYLCSREGKAEILNKKGDTELTIEDYREVNYLIGYGLIGRDKSTYTFLDDKGKPRGKNAEVYGIGMQYNIGSVTLTSEFVDLDGAATAIVNELTAQGFGKYKLGETSAEVFKGENPENYISQGSAKLPGIDLSGYRYEVVVIGSFHNPISVYDNVIDNETHEMTGKYVWYDKSTLAAIGFGLLPENSDSRKDAVEALSKAIVAGGYKELASTKKSTDEYGALYQKGDLVLLLYADSTTNGNPVGTLLKSRPDIIKEYTEGFKKVDAGEIRINQIYVPLVLEEENAEATGVNDDEGTVVP